MSDIRYLNRLFRDYYRGKRKDLPLVNSFNEREFGFIPWDKQIRMIRHTSFSSRENLMTNLFNNGPRHVYSSGALYQQPENQNMDGKGFKGCDLIIDIDADHFYTHCKEDHDLWYCKECGKSGKGTVNNCPNCKKSKFKTLTWICEECLDIAKNEIIKLIYDFFMNFGYDFKLTMVGDNNQLPPGKWGRILSELSQIKKIPVVRLLTNHRSDVKGENGILINARGILKYHQELRRASPEEQNFVEPFQFKPTKNFKIMTGGVDMVIKLISSFARAGIKAPNIMILYPYNYQRNETLNILNKKAQEVFYFLYLF